jgi:hypothetical protein
MPAVHGSPAEQYNEVKIVAINIVPFGDDKEITMTCQYGNTDNDDEWQPSIRLDKMPHTILNRDVVVDADGNEVEPAEPNYDLFVLAAVTSAPGAYIYDEVAESLYQWLLDEGIYEGTIV